MFSGHTSWYHHCKICKLSGVIITIANIIQTVPVIAMLAILMLSMGLGMNTVILLCSYMLASY